jgi:hypothetical protein
MTCLVPSATAAATVIALAAFASARTASAQSCHGELLDPGESSRFTASAMFVAGAFDRVQGKGDYEGLAATLKVRAGGARWGVTVPTWRIARAGSTTGGLGDVALRAEVPLVSLFDRALEVGVGVGATLPTGRSEDELGMGHAMAMPWLFGSLRLGLVNGEIEVGSAHAFADHVHTTTANGEVLHVSRPVVDPMNANEIWGSAAVSVPLGLFQLVPTLRGARPLGEGERRLNAGLGVRVPIGPVSAAAGAELPLDGDAFTWRTYLRGTLTF